MGPLSLGSSNLLTRILIHLEGWGGLTLARVGNHLELPYQLLSPFRLPAVESNYFQTAKYWTFLNRRLIGASS